MASEYSIRWTDESVRNLEGILVYLEENRSENEVIDFKMRLASMLNTLKQFPTLFPESEMVPRLRKAVLSPQTTILYEVQSKSINLIYLFDSRQNPSKVKER